MSATHIHVHKCTASELYRMTGERPVQNDRLAPGLFFLVPSLASPHLARRLALPSHVLFLSTGLCALGCCLVSRTSRHGRSATL